MTWAMPYWGYQPRKSAQQGEPPTSNTAVVTRAPEISIAAPRAAWLALYRKLYWENCYTSGSDDGRLVQTLLTDIEAKIQVSPDELVRKRP